MNYSETIRNAQRPEHPEIQGNFRHSKTAWALMKTVIGGERGIIPPSQANVSQSLFQSASHSLTSWTSRIAMRTALPGLEPEILDVRLLASTDLAVGKIGRLTSQDRDDIAALARRGLVHSASLRKRAEEAVASFVGDTTRLSGKIETACRIVADVESRSS